MANGNGNGNGTGSSSAAATLKKYSGVLTNLAINILFAILFYVIVCLLVAAYARFFSDREDSSSYWYNFPKWIKPQKFWKDLFGITVSTYSYSLNTDPMSVVPLTISGGSSFSNTSVSDCILKCEKNAPDCIGFLYSASNTCYLASSIDGTIPSQSGNTIYVVSGNEPTSGFSVKSGYIPATPTAVNISTINIPVESNIATVTTSTAHSFKTGNFVTIAGATGANGSNIITVTDTTHFTFPYRLDTTAAYTGGTATLVLSTIAPTTDDYLTCANKCYSNTSCTGFTSGASTCIQYTTALTNEMLTTAQASSNTYTKGTPTFSAYTGSYF